MPNIKFTLLTVFQHGAWDHELCRHHCPPPERFVTNSLDTVCDPGWNHNLISTTVSSGTLVLQVAQMATMSPHFSTQLHSYCHQMSLRSPEETDSAQSESVLRPCHRKQIFRMHLWGVHKNLSGRITVPTSNRGQALNRDLWWLADREKCVLRGIKIGDLRCSTWDRTFWGGCSLSFFFFFTLWERVLLCGGGWPQARSNSLASASWVLGITDWDYCVVDSLPYQLIYGFC